MTHQAEDNGFTPDYEAQKEGLGKYFLNSILSDIESLHIYAGIQDEDIIYILKIPNKEVKASLNKYIISYSTFKWEKIEK